MLTQGGKDFLLMLHFNTDPAFYQSYPVKLYSETLLR